MSHTSCSEDVLLTKIRLMKREMGKSSALSLHPEDCKVLRMLQRKWVV